MMHVTKSAKKKKGPTDRELHVLAVQHNIPRFAFVHTNFFLNDCPRLCVFCGADTYYVCTGCTGSSGQPLPLCVPSVRKKKGARKRARFRRSQSPKSTIVISSTTSRTSWGSLGVMWDGNKDHNGPKHGKSA